MQIAAGSGDVGMSERRLRQVNGRAAVEGVRSMSVAEPMGRDREFNAGAPGRMMYDAENSQGRGVPPFFPLRKTGSPRPPSALRSSLTSFQTEGGT